jgi:hypothetical protein
MTTKTIPHAVSLETLFLDRLFAIVCGRFKKQADLISPEMPVHPKRDKVVDRLGDSPRDKTAKQLYSFAMELRNKRHSIPPTTIGAGFGERETQIATLKQQERIVVVLLAQYLKAYVFPDVKTDGRTFELRRDWMVVMVDGPIQKLTAMAEELGVNFKTTISMIGGGGK